MTTVLLHPAAHRRLADEELVALVRAGNDTAFEVIVDRHRPALVAFARQLLGGAHHDAEECVQDALVRALDGLRSSSGEMALRAWLYTIVRNRCLDQLRRPARTVCLEPFEAVVGDRAGDPQARVLDGEELSALVRSIRALPARQRRALVMHELEGRSHADIARALSVSTGATKALVCRARGALAESRLAA
jgi:RNA polymerase sigma-70 factor (ECF subfamily)